MVMTKLVKDSLDNHYEFYLLFLCSRLASTQLSCLILAGVLEQSTVRCAFKAVTRPMSAVIQDTAATHALVLHPHQSPSPAQILEHTFVFPSCRHRQHHAGTSHCHTVSYSLSAGALYTIVCSYLFQMTSPSDANADVYTHISTPSCLSSLARSGRPVF